MLMMPLLNKLRSRKNNSHGQTDCRLLVNFGIGASGRDSVHFGADQVRILLFRECEWRGRKLLFDSVSAKKASNVTNDSPSQSNVKQANGPYTRNYAGLVAEHEKVACDDLSLLSEMVFGTVAMTYRGTLFKVHALNAPECIMCTKVFPAPDHSVHRLSERLTDDTLGHSTTVASNSSNGSTRNTMSHLSSGTLSANCLRPELRKNSTCSSTSSGWDIDVPLLGSSQSLESSSSSGFGSLTSLRRRWLRAVSTVLSHAELEEKFGIQAYCENAGNEGRDSSVNRRHKTRLGLAVLIQLTPGCQRQMEARLLEHAGQLEAMLNRLCYACIEACRSHSKSNGECKGLTWRMHRASSRCIAWLLRLLSNVEDNRTPSMWHEVIMNTTTTHVHRTNTLHRNLQQICQLINGVDTKSTNFFLSTVLTAVLTHHLGWVQTVMSPQHKQLMENLGKRYPCNPLWAQLGDLYGALGNPSRLVHTVITGDSEKAALINAVLTFLSYFIRSAVVKKRREYRCPSQRDVKEAIVALERAKRKNDLEESLKADNSRDWRDESTWARMRNDESRAAQGNRHESSKRTNSTESIRSVDETKSGPIHSGLQRLKRTTSAHKNLDLLSVSSFEARSKHLVKVESLDDEDPTGADVSLLATDVTKKNLPAGTVKIIVDEAATSPSNDFSGTKKRLPRVCIPPGYNLRDKMELEDVEHERLSVETKLTSLQARRNDSGFHSQKFYPEYCPVETQAFYARLDLPKDEQQSQVFFTLGDEAKTVYESTTSYQRPVDSDCQCSFAFTRVPSTSAELPEGVLRKIIQRNFPESSKSIERPPLTSLRNEKLAASCPKCNGAALTGPQSLEGSKPFLETPTNATEVLRTCGNSVGNRTARLLRSNSLEALMEANGVVELPMPRSKKSSSSARELSEVTDFTKTLLRRRVASSVNETVDTSSIYDAGYTSGLVIQGLTKRKRKKSKNSHGHPQVENEAQDVGTEWLSQLREEVNINAKFPVIDQPVSEALCILADMDNWQVGVLSNSSTAQSPLVPVGMSRLVATMLESFAYLWTKYRSPSHCIGIFEGKLREMWLRSEALAEMLMAVDVCDVTIASLTKALDLDAADIPLLLAVATTHSPQIAQRFGLGHDECCNCCCCCLPQPSCYYYWKPDVPIDDNTTYRLSYWDGPASVANAQISRPEDSLTVGDGTISDETIHKMSYLGNWCVKPEEPCSPCTKSWLGRGPMQDVTTQKHDYTWKMVEKTEPFKQQQGSLYCPCATMSDDTTYRLSYYDSTCRIPVKPFKPFTRYEKSDVPMEGCTTYRLSYWPNETPVKTPQVWNQKLQYVPPVIPMDGCTTYKLSYWPNNEPMRKPFTSQPETDNLLNVGCCFDDNTTYKLSYFGCGGERPLPAKPQSDAKLFSTCPLSYDTVNRLSYLGNWCVQPESPCLPCDKNNMGRGPMQDVTTQKHDYTWKNVDVTRPKFIPEDNLEFSPLPLECCTTHRLSYFPNNLQGLIRDKPFKPAQKYCPSGVPMENETTMRLSYQPVEMAIPPEKPWVTTAVYHPPLNPVEDTTTYNMSYIPPGTLAPLDFCSEPCPPSDPCAAPPCPPCPPSVTRPCNLNAFS